MKKGIKAISIGVLGVLGLTGCSTEEKDRMEYMQNVLTEKIVADQNVSSKVEVDNVTYTFTEYQVYDQGSTVAIDVHGKLTDGENYNSFVKVGFEGVDKTDFDVNGDKIYVYQKVTELADSGIDYSITTHEVESFDKLDKSFGKIVPKRCGVYNLKKIEVLKVDNISYDQANHKLTFSTDCVANYEEQYTYMMDSNGITVPITNYYYKNVKYDYDASCDISLEEYIVHEGDTKYFTSKFASYVENGQEDKYSVKETNQTVLDKTAPKNQKESTDDLDL